MATQITIGNKTTQVPGVYARIVSGIVNPPSAVDYGNVVIIDDGTLKVDSYIAINGVKGTNKNGLESVLEFTSLPQITNYIWDSQLLPIVKSLFIPSRKDGISGVNKLTIIQASETTPATTNVPFTNSTSGLVLKTQFEGESLNGGYVPSKYDIGSPTTITANELGKGLAVRLEAGRSFGYCLVFYRGVSDKTEDLLNPGFGYNERPLVDPDYNAQAGTYNVLPPQPLFRSPDVKKLSELKRWMEKSNDFKRWFKIDSFVFDSNTDLITPADITDNYTVLAPYKLFAGATTDFTPAAYSDALNLVAGLDNSFFLALKSGDEAMDANNDALFGLLKSGQLTWEKFMFVAGYDDASSFLGDTDTTQSIVKFYNSQYVTVVHGSAKVSNIYYPEGYRNISTLEKTAKVLGRLAGLPPQTPVTWKDIDIAAETHRLSEGDKEAAMENGILCTFYDTELTSFVVLSGINTLGNNEFLIVGEENENAQSYSIQIMRIISQLNKEIIFGAKRAFLSKEQGPNRNTASPEDLITWTKGFLNTKVATNQQDNLIVRAGQVTAYLDQDNIYVNYEFEPNGEISKLIFTGVII